MISKGLLVLALSLFATSFAQAREFYKEGAKFSLSYTSLDSGTVSIVKVLPVEVRFSDDDQFCTVIMGNSKLACSIEKTSHYGSEYRNVYLMKAQWMTVLSDLRVNCAIPDLYYQKLIRIMGTLQGTDGNLWIARYQNSRVQLDDSEPEAFHVEITDSVRPSQM